MRRIRKVAIANRGEIACRIIRACRERGIATVALFSDPDRGSMHVRMADEAWHIGPASPRESYLDIDRVLGAIKRSGADAVHPGYGFLSENADFARACETAGLVFIGPPAEAIEAMGEKTRARALMASHGVPVVPGGLDPANSVEEALGQAERVGYPVMLKAAAGGGGKGMRSVAEAARMEGAFLAAASEAANAFGDGRVYVEKLVEEPRHIEIQVFADAHGNALHLNERECSIQRRHQKVIEEAPSPFVDAALRARMGEVAVRAARSVGYVGAGTVEFLVDARRDFYFLEMNTRLQVEHPVTEWITGLDLVHWQLDIAAGGRLPLDEPPLIRGHAIEARICAEDPAADFCPTPGTIATLDLPAGPGVRLDSGIYEGWEVPSVYDPLLAKLAVWAPTRDEAIARLDRALGEFRLSGLSTNVAWLRAALAMEEFRAGRYDTGFVARHRGELVARSTTPLSEEDAALCIGLARHLHGRPQVAPTQPGVSAWRRR